MTGQAGSHQPSGQVDHTGWRAYLRSLTNRPITGLVVAGVLMLMPFNRGGLWDPHELRVAELARRLAPQLFGTRAVASAGSAQLARVTAEQIGHGELSVTSPALGFALFGVSDWSGRVSSVFWGVVTLVCLWVLIGRVAGRFAQTISVLLLATTPLFVWQSTTMTGDAATIGTLALSTSGLLLLVVDDSDAGTTMHRARRTASWLMAIAGLGAGILCRGILIGVAVPCLAAGLVGLTRAPAAHAVREVRIVATLLFATGVAIGAVGVRLLLQSPKGFSFLLGSTLSSPDYSAPFDRMLGNLLHQVFPLSILLPAAVLILFGVRRQGVWPGAPQSPAVVGLLLVVVLALAATFVMGTRGAQLPFPAVMALAGICGLALERMHHDRRAATFAGLVVVTLAVLIAADFVNLPDKIMLMSGVNGAQFPESFRMASQHWLFAALAVLGGGVVLATLAQVRGVGWRARYRGIVEATRVAYGGQLINGFVLLETALVTTALLQRAHNQGWIAVPAFDAVRSLAGPLLLWSWLAPPILLYAVPLVYASLEGAAAWLTEVGPRTALPASGETSTVASSIGAHAPSLTQPGLSRGVLLGLAVVASGFLLSAGHGPALAEQVSPKRVLRQYLTRAHADEPLALLGIKPESAAYYLGTAPKAFDDVELAAQWLHSPGATRRWIVFSSDRLAELNAASRAVSHQRNLVIMEPVSGSVLSATTRLLDSEHDHNPLSRDVLTAAPATAHVADATFGNWLRCIGWEVTSDAGGPVTELHVGAKYEITAVFKVLGTTDSDWQIFVHLDGAGSRHNADHDPLRGRYPTTLWQPGDVIVDRHEIMIGRGSPPGLYVLYFGLFLGSRRSDVTKGPSEDNRVRLGEFNVL